MRCAPSATPCCASSINSSFSQLAKVVSNLRNLKLWVQLIGMDDYLTTQDVADTFDVSPQTVKNWCDAFADFLSPTATPGERRRRLFVSDDLGVFALVFDFHRRGYTYDDAKAALAAGQRGDVPTTTIVTPAIPPTALVKLREEIQSRDLLIQELRTQRDMAQGKVEQLEKLLREQITERDRQIRALLEELAEMKARKTEK
jgi:DNA-binding transcriptional MerR regulator